jgi:ubiquinone/menaquinone biosynthesis C-methylase UbiE
MEVKETYEVISDSFDKTRYKVWPCVANFLNSLPEHSYGLEVGCGNGKNMLYRKNLKLQGIDICSSFVQKCKEKNLSVDMGTMISLPYRDNSFDFVYCIAALHHLETSELRLKAIQEMIRVCKPGGKIFILVWAFEQESDSKRKFETQDTFVSWKDENTKTISYRFYHVYTKNELESEISSSSEYIRIPITIQNSFYEKGNYGVVFEKIY